MGVFGAVDVSVGVLPWGEWSVMSIVGKDVEVGEVLGLAVDGLIERVYTLDVIALYVKSGPEVVDVTEDSTIVRRGSGLEKRGTFMRVVQIDCHQYPLMCKNVGWYQKCLRQAKGDYTKVTYTNGPEEKGRHKPIAEKKRLESGVTVSWATPCNARPFSQRTYGLQADEWLMAMFENVDFDPQARIPQVSLRCMDGTSNGGGASQITNFRRCWGDYAESGKWAHWRQSTILPSGDKECLHLVTGGTLHVQFNFDDFRNNPRDNELRRQVFAF